jgi:hypothetical protein
MANEPIQFPSIIANVRSLKDSTLKVTLELNELPPEETAKIFAFSNEQVWAALSPTELTGNDLEVPEITADVDEGKSPSQRLRDRMFVYYRHKNDTVEGFEVWYRDKLNVFGERFLDAIDNTHNG